MLFSSIAHGRKNTDGIETIVLEWGAFLGTVFLLSATETKFVLGHFIANEKKMVCSSMRKRISLPGAVIN